MQNTFFMSGIQPTTELSGNVDALVRRQPTDPSHQSTEVLPVNEFHRQEVHSVDFTNVVDTADIRVGNLSGEPDLVVQQFQPRGVAGQGLGQEFQCNRLSQFQVVGTVDVPHASLAQ